MWMVMTSGICVLAVLAVVIFKEVGKR